MPTQWIVKRAPERRASGDASEETSEDGFIVIADNDNENHLTARFATSSALSVPRFGEIHPLKPSLFCLGSEAVPRKGSLNVFDATARYTSRRDANDEDTEENPLLRRPKKRVTFQDEVEPYLFDEEGFPSLMPNGLIMNPLPVRDVSRPILEISKNVLATSIGELMYYTNKVNSDLWFGWLPGEVRLKIVGGEEQEENNVRFVNFTYQLMFRETQTIFKVPRETAAPVVVAYVDGWDRADLAQGFSEVRWIDSVTGLETTPDDADGVPTLFKIRRASDPDLDYGTSAPASTSELITDPALLDEFGKVLMKPGDNFDTLANADIEPAYVITRPYKRIAFGPLNLL